LILDTSAIIAILRCEPEAAAFLRLVDGAPIVRISAGNYVEAGLIADLNPSPIAHRKFDDFMVEAEVVIEPVTEVQARLARAAYRDFGRGSGHPAKLNFGDCFAYALAKTTREPLLFKGSDFTHVDVTPAL
jgi:ribonuclease VapC